MVEVTEVLRLWRAGLPKKRIAAQLGLAPRTVRRLLAAAAAADVSGDAGAVTDDEVRDTLLALHAMAGRPRGDGWAQCAAHRLTIDRLGDGLRLTKIQKLLTRQGVAISYPTLYRFAVSGLQFGQADQAGPVIGRFAAALLEKPLPWTRMRRVYALLSLVKRYGPARVTEACTAALAADMLDVRRLQRLLVFGLAAPPAPPHVRTLPRARYLRPAHQYALPLRPPADREESQCADSVLNATSRRTCPAHCSEDTHDGGCAANRCWSSDRSAFKTKI